MSDGRHRPEEPADRAATTAPVQDWLGRLAERGGAPGGGSASGILLGIGAALLSMVLSYDTEAGDRRERAERLRARVLTDAEHDATVSADLGDAMALPKDDPDRDDRIREAAATGAESSVRLAAAGIELVDLLDELVPDAAAFLSADLGVAAEALAAGLGGALINLRGDLALIDKRGGDVPAHLLDADRRMDAARHRAAAHAAAIREA